MRKVKAGIKSTFFQLKIFLFYSATSLHMSDEKELESFLRSFRKTIFEESVKKNYNGSFFICSDGRIIKFPRQLFPPINFEEQEAKRLNKLVDLFLTCEGQVLFLNTGLGFIMASMLGLACAAGVNVSVTDTIISSDILTYIMPHVGSYSSTYETILGILGELVSPNILVLDIQDPLEQVIKYFDLYLYHRIPDIIKKKLKYVCFNMYDVLFESFNTAKESIAYCTTFASLLKQDKNSVNLIEYGIRSLRQDIASRVKDYIASQKDFNTCSDFNKLLDALQDEIKRANELMQKYDIIRVVFPPS